MMIIICCLTLNIIMVSGSSLSDQVHQYPADMFNTTGGTVTISCSHSIQSYNQILWYKQQNRKLQYLGYMTGSAGLTERGLDVKIEGNANAGKTCTLTVPGVNVSSSAIYFCAARTGNNAEAYFGQGTKLTVLEADHEVTKPNVTVLAPSPSECRNQKASARKKTLVCLATGFYPDHVSVFWKVDGEDVKDGVATDSSAIRPKGEKFYKISSRLRVSANDWFTAGKEFECIVRFFNWNSYENVTAKAYGEKPTTTGKSLNREEYLRISQAAKLSYGVFIAKSCVYGAFVAFLVYKLQGSAGKQRH